MSVCLAKWQILDRKLLNSRIEVVWPVGGPKPTALENPNLALGNPNLKP